MWMWWELEYFQMDKGQTGITCDYIFITPIMGFLRSYDRDLHKNLRIWSSSIDWDYL